MTARTNPFKVVLGGVDVSALVDVGSVQVHLPTNRRGATASFKLIKRPTSATDTAWKTYNVAPLSTVVIYDIDGTTPIFNGVVTKPSVHPIPGSHNEWTCPCLDTMYYLGSVLVNVAYDNATDQEIVQGIFAAYLPGVSTSTYVTNNGGIQHALFSYRTIEQALKKLAKLTASVNPIIWWVDASLNMHWTTIDQLGACPYWFSDRISDAAAEAYEWQGFEYSEDATQISNLVTVQGATILSNPFTDRFTGDGHRSSWVMSYPPSQEGSAMLPIVTVNGVAQTVAYDPGTLGGTGVTPPTPTTQWLVGYSASGLSGAPPVGNLRIGTASTPANGDQIVVQYQADVPLVMNVQNSASITQYNTAGSLTAGVHRIRINDTTIRTTAAARASAASHLSRAAYHVPAAKLTLPESFTGVGILPGQIVRVVNSQIGLDANFVIVAVTYQGTQDGGRKVSLEFEGAA